MTAEVFVQINIQSDQIRAMVSVVDGVLHHLGKPGGFHLLVTVLLCCNFFPITFHHLSFIFFGDSIPHTCRLPEGWPWHKKFSIPRVTTGEQSKYDECHMFVDPNSANLGTKSCVYGWEFYPKAREWTIISEWGLVCEREYLVTLASVVYHGGVMFGGLVFGTLADKFGRKPLMLFTLYVQTAISIGIYFVQNFILFVILRFIHGLLLQGLQCTTICLVMELLPMRYRTAAGMGCSIVWALGMITLSLVSYSVQHWRYIQLAISLPCIVTFVYIWLIPESVRWLVTVMKTENALIAARKFEHFNKRPLGEEFSKDVELATKQITSSVGHVESYGMRELLLQGSKLRISSLVLCFCWLATSSLYHGLSILLIEIGSSRYTSTLILGTVDLVAFVVMYFLLVRFGRKRPLCALLVVCGAVCISTVIAENLEKGDGLEAYVVSRVMALVERSCIAACISGLGICAAELFPTVVRTFGIGVCLFCGQIGWIMAPQILKLGQFSLKSLPWIVFGILNLLAGLLILLLPETLAKPLPDTLEDMESFESRKAPLKNKEKETTATSPSGYVDWKTTYKQKIEEANGSLALADASDDQKAEPEKRWYRRSAKVVRFYGLDCSEDPCQEVKTNKKQRIRMVRFSFENEEFCIDPRVPNQAAARRFSVIREEPELETVLDENNAATNLEEVATGEAVPDSGIHEGTEVGLVEADMTPCDLSFQQLILGVAGISVQGVAKMVTPPSPSRFKVQKVAESQMQLPPVSAPKDCIEGQDLAGSPSENCEDVSAAANSPRFIVERVPGSVSMPLEAHLEEIPDQSTLSSVDMEEACQDMVQESLDSSVSSVVACCSSFEGNSIELEPCTSNSSTRFKVRRISESLLQQDEVVPQCDVSPCDSLRNPSTSSISNSNADETLPRYTVQLVSESNLSSKLARDVLVDNDDQVTKERFISSSASTKASVTSLSQSITESIASDNIGKKGGESTLASEVLSSGCDCSTEEKPVTKTDVTCPVVPCSRFLVRRVSESKLSSPLASQDILPERDCIPSQNNTVHSPSTVELSRHMVATDSKSLPQPIVTSDDEKNSNLPVHSVSLRFMVQRVSELDPNLQRPPLPRNGSETVSEDSSKTFLPPDCNVQPLESWVEEVEKDRKKADAAVPRVSSRFIVRRVSESKLSEPAFSLQGSSNVEREKVNSSTNDSIHHQTGDGTKNVSVAPSAVSSRFTVRRVSESRLSEPVSSSQVECSDVDLSMSATNDKDAVTAKNSRFTVRRVSESKAAPEVPNGARVPEVGDCSGPAVNSAPSSRFVIQKVPEPHLQDSNRYSNGTGSGNGNVTYDTPLILDPSQLSMIGKPARFHVHCDTDTMLNIENFNNNDNNNNNDNDKYVGFKNVLESSIGPANKPGYEKLQNCHISGSVATLAMR